VVLAQPRHGPHDVFWSKYRFDLCWRSYLLVPTGRDSELVSHVLGTFNATSNFLSYPFLDSAGHRAAQSDDFVFNINVDGRIP
jgi:hypothetical protein